MRNVKINRMIKGILLLYPIFLLTACTARNDIVLELDGKNREPETEWEAVQETQEEQELQEVQGTQSGQDALGEPEAEEPGDIYVHICGAVVKPGVYQLAAGSRVFEGIEAAGGFREDACGDFVNQAGVLQDGQRISIPTLEEAEAAKESGVPLYEDSTASEASAQAQGAGDALVNINTASESELSQITGIGAGKAAAIVRYREENGKFASIEDIMKVSGIKEGTFEKIKDKITVK